MGARVVRTPEVDFEHDLRAMAEAVTSRTKLIFVASPNNPTGSYSKEDDLKAFLAAVPRRVVVILDEAYYEFAMIRPSYPDSMHYRFDNVITLRTFSKAYGLASARIGYGFAHADLISMLLKIKLPFEPAGPSEAAALGALEDREFLLHTVANNAKGLAYLNWQLPKLGLRIIPSAGNFVMLVMNSVEDAAALFEGLLRRAVIVRPLAATGLPPCLRISVGTPEENEALVAALTEVCEEMELHHAATTK
jgi:histidinol-phosphate aminotransferase